MLISKLIILSLLFSATLQENIVLNLEQDAFQSILQKHLEESMSFTFLPKNFVFHDTMKGSLTSFSLSIPEKKDMQVRFVEPKGVEFSVKNPQFVFEMPCTSKTNTSKTLIQHVEFTVSEMKLYFQVRGRLPSLRTADFSEGKGTIDSVKFKTEPAQIDSLKQLPSVISDFNGIVFEAFRFRTGELTVKLNKFLKSYKRLREVFPFKANGKTVHYMGNFGDFPFDNKSNWEMKISPKDPQGLYINTNTIMDYVKKMYKEEYDLPYLGVRDMLKSISEFIEPEILEKTLKNLDKIAENPIQLKYDKYMYLVAYKEKDDEFYFSLNMIMMIKKEGISESKYSYFSPRIRFDAKVEQNILKISWIKADTSKYEPFNKDDMSEEKVKQTEAILNEILAGLASNFERTLNNIDITRIFDLSQLFGLSNIPMDIEKIERGIRFNITK